MTSRLPVADAVDDQQPNSYKLADSPSEHVFRTVLPHEPLPGGEGPGYLHVQGSFQPKITGTATEKTQNSQCGNDDEAKAKGELSADNHSLQENLLWTTDALRRAICAYFSLQSTETASRLLNREDFAPIDVHILDQSPPFTKIRLQYTSSHHAFQAMMKLKENEITPSDILSGSAAVMNFTDVPAGSSVTFSARPLQVTLITEQALKEPGWGRSNPPKFRRLIARNACENESILQLERQETRFVWMSNLFKASEDQDMSILRGNRWIVAAAIRAVVDKFDSSGQGVEVFLSSNKASSKSRNLSASCCHVGMRSAADAQALIRNLQGQTVVWKFQINANDDARVIELPSGVLFLDYAAITHRSALLDQAKSQGLELPKGEPTRPECTSTTAHVNVPGLVIVHDFITEAQEAALVAVLTGPQAPWAPSQANPSETGAVKRRVQHYGYVFDYKTADVLRNREDPDADCPPMPAMLDVDPGSNEQNRQEDHSHRIDETDLDAYLDHCVNKGEGWGLLAGVAERVRQYDFNENGQDGASRRYPKLNQLTINQYKPGEGIGSHVDTLSAFGDGLLSLSLNSGIVMEFRKVDAKDGGDRKKLVYLPRRSIVLMSEAARFEWEHMIVTRTTDVHNGELMSRDLRISLTFRTALDPVGIPLPLIQSSSFPPTWGSKGSMTSTLRTPACERDHVHAVYDAIAVQWHHTRGRRGVLWPGATRFLQELESGSIVADVGCGDGKYFPPIWQGGSYVIGTDISIPLLKTAFLVDQDEALTPENRRVSDERRHLRTRPAVCAADCMHIPLQSKRCDAAICIAVLHHLSTKSRRQRCIEELIRIVKPGGLINIQAWALTQEKDSRRSFAASDVFVPFNAQPKYLKAAANDVPKCMKSDATYKSTAQVYSEALNAEFDDRKGLVVFKRYCHMYKEGELEELLVDMSNVKLVDSGFEAGNYYIIVRVVN
jgi:alkylated DNA repair dioxygenase AlkB/SAM-dependent methyltransferase